MCSHGLQLRNLPEYPDGIFHRTHFLNHHRTAAVSLTQVAAMSIHGSVCDALPESLALEISTLLVLHEIKHHAPGLEEYLFLHRGTCRDDGASLHESIPRPPPESLRNGLSYASGMPPRLHRAPDRPIRDRGACARYCWVHNRREKRHLQIALQRALVHKVLTAQVVPLPDFLGIEVAELIILQFLHGLGQDFLIGFISQIGDETALLGPPTGCPPHGCPSPAWRCGYPNRGR